MVEADAAVPEEALHPAEGRRIRDPRSRGRTAVAAVLVVAAGLVVHAVVPGFVGDFTGDVLYAVLVYLLAAFLLPRTPAIVPAAIAVAVSCLIEVWQLTGGPADLAAAFPPARFVVGTTFSALDLLGYALGAVVGALADPLLLRQRRG
jgi:hypothetical protein